MFEHYEKREPRFGPPRWGRWALRLLFLGSFGFAGGILFLLFFLVPVEKWLAERETAQQLVNAALTLLIVAWILISLAATVLYDRLFLKRRRDRAAGLGVLAASLAFTGFTFFFLLDTDLLVALDLTGREEVRGERLTFGSYPDEEKLRELEDEGYDGVITLLNPDIPFERVLLEREQANAEEIGIPVRSYPMLPWISQNERALSGIAGLIGDGDSRYYIHCYLGKHRVELVRRELDAGGAGPASEPLPDSLERGELRSYDGGRVILGPLPTDEEWLDIILRQGVEEVVTTLDPASPEDAERLEEERKVLEGSGITVTGRPLDPVSPDPREVRSIADYAAGSDRPIYLHDFGYDARAEALDGALRESLEKGSDPGG